MEHEEQDEYLRVVSNTFGSEKEGYQFYNEYAKVKGFSVRKEEVKYLPGTRTRFRRLYTCLKEGFPTWMVKVSDLHVVVSKTFRSQQEGFKPQKLFTAERN